MVAVPAAKRSESAEPPPRQWWDASWLVVLAIAGAATVLNQSAVHWGANIVDDHLFGYYGWCVTQGARPYVDFWDNKPPAIWWLNAAAMQLVGRGIAANVALGTVALLVSQLAFVGVARSVFHKSLTVPAALLGATLLTPLRFECGGNRTETFVVVCELLAVLGYLQWRHGRSCAWLIGAAIAAGCAPLFKQSGLAVTAAIGVHLVVASRRGAPDTRRPPWRLMVLAAAAWCAGPLLTGGALAAQGALGKAAFAVGRFNRAYFAVNDATWVGIGRAVQVYMPVLEVIAPVLALGGAGVLLAVFDLRRRKRRTGARATRVDVWFLVLWFVLAVYLACVGPGRRGHHFMPALPALGLLALVPLQCVAAEVGLWRRLTSRAATAGVLVVWLYLVGVLWPGQVAALRRVWKIKPSWAAWQRSEPPAYRKQAAALRNWTAPDERIYVWGWSPGTYRYAYRLPASRFATLEKLGQVGPHAAFILDGAVADLLADPPAAFVVSTADRPGLPDSADRPLQTWLHERYARIDTIDGMHIYLRRATED